MKMTKNRKSAGRRRSCSLVGFASKDLCETIPKSLSSSERLLMLIERSFQYALTAVQKDVMLNETFDISNFRKDGTNCWEQIKSVIEEQKLCDLAITDSTISDQSLLAVKDVESEKLALQAEHDKWNEKLEYYREELKKEINNPYEISADWKGKEMLFDYSDVIQDTSSIHMQLQEQILSLERPKAHVESSIKLANILNHLLLVKCESYFEPKRNSPKTIIKKIVTTSKIIKHHRYS